MHVLHECVASMCLVLHCMAIVCEAWAARHAPGAARLQTLLISVSTAARRFTSIYLLPTNFFVGFVLIVGTFSLDF